jgi:hypothetical protein
MLDSSKDENQHVNMHMVSDDDGANQTSKRLAKSFNFLKEYQNIVTTSPFLYSFT